MTTSAPADDEIERQIDKLVHLEWPHNGESFWNEGPGLQLSTPILPDDHATADDKKLRDQQAAEQAAAYLVRRGVDAVPFLIAHLEDDRPIAMVAVHGARSPYYDFNSNPLREQPFGATLGESPQIGDSEEYRFTVGDVCYAQLGQILNRDFDVLSSAGCMGFSVYSIRASTKVRLQVKKEWGGLTRAKHRDSLIADFRYPDSPYRRHGAYVRLACYYPEAVEAVVVEELRRPTVDSELATEFCRTQLYRDADIAELRKAFEEFVAVNGKAAAEGVRTRLFSDLASLEQAENDDSDDVEFPYGAHPRRVLIDLFHHEPDVTSADEPPRRYATDNERVELISVMTRDTSPAIGREVEAYLLAHPQHPGIVPAALCCLANRGYGPLLTKYLGEIDLLVEEVDRDSLARLQAIAISRDPLVRENLTEFLKSASQEEYVVAAAEGVMDKAAILGRVNALLGALPEETIAGGPLLQLVARRCPDEGRGTIARFLQGRHPNRIATVCEVCSDFEEPLFTLLAPFLDDERRVPDSLLSPQGLFTRTSSSDKPLLVRDVVALAISSHHPEMEYDSDWSVEIQRDAIERLKAFCREQMSSVEKTAQTK